MHGWYLRPRASGCIGEGVTVSTKDYTRQGVTLHTLWTIDTHVNMHHVIDVALEYEWNIRPDDDEGSEVSLWHMLHGRIGATIATVCLGLHW